MKRGVYVKRLTYFIIALLLFTVVATAASYYYYPPYYGSYSSIARRYYYAPSSQELYFGKDYVKPLGGFGSKGTQSDYPRVSGGAKGYNSPTTNLLTNSFTSQGRNPNKISNWDPRFRGFNRLDTAVILEPPLLTQQDRSGTRVFTRGTVRLVSQYGNFGAGGGDDTPMSQIFMQIRDLPPIGTDTKYELWLFDFETGQPLSLGLFYSGIGGTGQARVEFPKSIVDYDFVAVTKEPFPDYDPRPGDIILMGAIEPSRTKSMAEFVRSLK